MQVLINFALFYREAMLQSFFEARRRSLRLEKWSIFSCLWLLPHSKDGLYLVVLAMSQTKHVSKLPFKLSMRDILQLMDLDFCWNKFILKHATSTSKKVCKKEPQSFSHCGSFDHPDLQSLNDYKKIFSFCDCKFKCLWACDILLKRHFKTFPTIYYVPQNT